MFWMPQLQQKFCISRPQRVQPWTSHQGPAAAAGVIRSTYSDKLYQNTNLLCAFLTHKSSHFTSKHKNTTVNSSFYSDQGKMQRITNCFTATESDISRLVPWPSPVQEWTEVNADWWQFCGALIFFLNKKGTHAYRIIVLGENFLCPTTT